MFEKKSFMSTYWPYFLILSVGVAGCFLPTFDFDESFYRACAQAMKRGAWPQDLWVPQWDGRPVHDKPPLFLWCIVAMSFLVDGPGPTVSVFASRLPGVLATLATLTLLGRRHPRAPGAFALGWVPALGAGAVLLDPLLMAALTPWALHNPRSARTPRWALVLSMGFGLATKGLIGGILPALALGTYGFVSLLINKGGYAGMRPHPPWPGLKSLMAHEGAAWVGGALLGLVFYGFLYTRAGGQDFVRDFFVVHHFQRGSEAFEGHGGGPWYHPLVFLIGGGPLAFSCLASVAQKKAWTEEPFSFIWALVTLVFFSFMATKLPNYIWPLWPAVALMAAHDHTPWPRPLRLALLWPVPLGLALAVVPFAVGWLADYTPLDSRALFFIKSFLPIPTGVWVGLGALGAGLVGQAVWLYRGGTGAIGALGLGLTLGVFAFAIGPIIDHHVHTPIRLLVERSRGETLGTLGMKSPTVSLAYGEPLEQHSKGNTSVFQKTSVVMAPFWLEHRCREQGFFVSERVGYLVLCRREDP